MQKLRYRSIGISAILFSSSPIGFCTVVVRAAFHEAELVKDRAALRALAGGSGLTRLAPEHFGAARSHLANCRHARIGSSAIAWEDAPYWGW